MAVSGYSEEGLLKKHPLLGTTHLGSSGRARTEIGRNIHRLRDKAIEGRLYGKQEFLQATRPEFQRLKEQYAPGIMEAKEKHALTKSKADLYTNVIRPWYRTAFKGRDDFQRMLAVPERQLHQQAKESGEKVKRDQAILDKAATPYNQFFGGRHFDSSTANVVINPYRYDIGGRDWKKRFIRGGTVKGYTQPTGAGNYPGAPRPAGSGRYLTLLNTPLSR